MSSAQQIRLRFAADAHGTTFLSEEMQAKAARNIQGKNIDPRDWRREILLREKQQLTEEEYEENKVLVLENPYWFRKVQLDRDVEFVFNRLEHDGHFRYIITESGDAAYETILDWRKWHGMLEDVPLLTCGRGAGKVEIAKALKLDVILDNKLKVLRELEGIVEHRFLISRGYNLHERPEAYGIKRVLNWHRFYYKELATLADPYNSQRNREKILAPHRERMADRCLDTILTPPSQEKLLFAA